MLLELHGSRATSVPLFTDVATYSLFRSEGLGLRVWDLFGASLGFRIEGSG